MPMMKKVLFHDFQMFFIVFDHGNTCTSMHSLVEIHKLILFIELYVLITRINLIQDELHYMWAVQKLRNIEEGEGLLCQGMKGIVTQGKGFIILKNYVS